MTTEKMPEGILRRSVLHGAAGLSLGGMLPYAAMAQVKNIGNFEYGVASIDPSYAMAYVALKKGYFSEAGLDVKYLNAQSGPRAKQMLAAGQIQMATTGVNDSLALSLAGKPSVLVASFDNRVPFANILINKKVYDSGVKDVKALAGRSMGVTQPQSATWLMATYIADKAGLKDKIAIKPLGDFATMMGAVKSGAVDCCTATFGMLEKAQEEGWGVALFDITNDATWNALFGGDVNGVGCYVLEEMIEKRPEAVQAMVTGIVKATNFIKNSSPSEIAQLIYGDYLQGYSMTAVVSAITVYKKTWSQDNRITRAHYDRLIGIMDGRQFTSTELKTVPYEKSVNMRFVENARKG
jgi:NitT/TauT family transport system substrate-binding protein